MADRTKTYHDVINEAVDDMTANGYDSTERISYWQQRIKEAAEAAMGGRHRMEELLREAMAAVYRRLIEKGQIARYHQGVGRFTLDRVRPQLRAELDRRIMASADLIKLNRQEAIEKTLRRFAGWSTSIPKGGAAPGQKTEAKVDLKKALKQLPFSERRCLIDQGHKLTASLNEVLATDGGAIAGRWRSHYKQQGYNFRETHKERDYEWNKSQGREWVYLMRNSWAQQNGLVKPGPAGYYDQITSAAEEPFCRCYVTWLYTLGKLPPDMLTKKGEAALAEVQRKIRDAA
jgi:hypothetical protein